MMNALQVFKNMHMKSMYLNVWQMMLGLFQFKAFKQQVQASSSMRKR